MTTPNEDRSAINSAGSQRVSTNMTGPNESALERAAKFDLYLVKPGQVQDLWEAKDPNAHAQKLLLEHIQEVSESTETDWRTWDENEDRFEANELKWIADYVVRNLVFIRTDLKVEDLDATCHIMQILWKALDLLNSEASQELSKALDSRYELLRNGLKRLFEERLVTKEHVQKILEYTRRTIFGHLQLYLACIGQKKQASRVKRVEIFTETPQIAEVGDLETECREVIEEGRAATPEELLAGETAVNDEQMDGEENKEEEDQEDIVDPNDPLYGLEARLAQLDLDEESKAVLKAKLMDASNKIKDGLEKRQQDLDTKLASMPAGARKR